ncbi:hypothetical protein [Cupriavidus necator]
MNKLTAQEIASLAAQLDAEGAHIRAAVGAADTPMPPGDAARAEGRG